MSVPDPKKATEDLFSAAKDMVNEAKDGFLKEAAEKEVAEKTTQLAEEILTHTCSEITKQIGGKDGMIHEITKSIITDLREYLKTNDFSFKFIEVLQNKLLNEKSIKKPFLKKLVSSFNAIVDQSRDKWLERESSDNETAPIVGGNERDENSLSKISTGRELDMNPLAKIPVSMDGTSLYLNGTENEGEDDTKGTENEGEDDTKGTENNTENARNASNPNGTINNTEYVGNLSNPNFSQNYNPNQMFENDPKKLMAEMGQSTSEVHNKLDDAYQEPNPEPKPEEPINDQDDVKTLTQQLVDGLKEKIMEKKTNIVDHIKDVAQKTLIEKIYSDKFSFDFVEVLQTKLLNDSTQEEVLVDKFHEVYNAIMIKVVGKFNNKTSNNSKNNKNSDMYDPNGSDQELKLMTAKVEELQDQNTKLQEQINEMKGTDGNEKDRNATDRNATDGNEKDGNVTDGDFTDIDGIEGGGKGKNPKKPKKTIRKRRKSRKKGKKTKRVRFL